MKAPRVVALKNRAFNETLRSTVALIDRSAREHWGGLVKQKAFNATLRRGEIRPEIGKTFNETPRGCFWNIL